MAKEIERKFLTVNDSYKNMAIAKKYIMQGYLITDKNATVRIRIINEQAFVTIKSETINMTRDEWEYSIPLPDAKEMLQKLPMKGIIEKNRYYVNFGGNLWEIDEFLGANSGLTIAEIEMEEETEKISLPPFIGCDVTGNPTYYNSSLAVNPISK